MNPCNDPTPGPATARATQGQSRDPSPTPSVATSRASVSSRGSAGGNQRVVNPAWLLGLCQYVIAQCKYTSNSKDAKGKPIKVEGIAALRAINEERLPHVKATEKIYLAEIHVTEMPRDYDMEAPIKNRGRVIEALKAEVLFTSMNLYLFIYSRLFVYFEYTLFC